MISKEEYLEELRKRAKKSRVYQDYQLIGLEVANLLGDIKHKSLYIKLAKEYRNVDILKLAKEIAEKKEIQNKGAYFTKIFFEKYKPKKNV